MTTLAYHASDTDRVLDALKAAKGEWVGGLYQRLGCMIHSRVSNLRQRGYLIEAKCFGKGDWRYRLLDPTWDHR
jgi:hypothetical protein